MKPIRSLSVVMPTYNRRPQLALALAALRGQKVDAAFEIVVVSDGSTDDTDDFLHGLEPDPLLRVFCQENMGPAAARNLGVSEASGELLVFIDDDVIATEDLLQMHLDAHRRAGDDDIVVIGPMLDPPDFEMQPWVRWEQRMLLKQYTALEAAEYEPTPRQFYTGNASTRREHVTAAGGFDPTFRRAEDVELAYRLADLGLRFEFVAPAIGHHYAERSFAAWKSAAYSYGRNDVIFARDRGRTWIFGFIVEKYAAHQIALRALIAISLQLPFTRPLLGKTLRGAAAVADRARSERLMLAAYSGIYAIEYHTGIAHELGGNRRFLELLRKARRHEGG